MHRTQSEPAGRRGRRPDRQRALELAYRYVDRRDRTVAELRRHLGSKECEQAVVEETIRELGELGAVDDARFARLFTEDKRELEKWGRARIEQSLLGRGIDRDIVVRALGAQTEESELDRARAVLEVRFPRLLLDRRDRERAIGMLFRKGFDSDVAVDAVRAHTGRHDED